MAAMTTISAGELLVWRGLKGMSILLLAFMIRLGRETGEVELSTLLKIDRKTIRAHLQSLSAINFVARAGLRESWTVTSAGRQLVLPLNSALEDGMEAICGNGEILPIENGNGENLPIREGNFSPFDESLSLKSESKLKTLVKDFDSDLDSGSSKNNLSGILTASKELFGEPVVCSLDADPGLVLAAIAEAYDKRARFRKPARVAAVNVRSGRVGAAYRKDPALYLPDSFKRLIGMTIADKPSAYQVEDYGDDDYQEPVMVDLSDESIHGLTPGGHLSFEAAWRAVIGQLQMEMPKAAFDTWVNSAQLLSIRDGCVFVVGVANDYAAGWLHSRLHSTIKNLLTGICNGPADVVFETMI